MAELVEQYSIKDSEAFADVLEGYTTLGRTERGKLYGEKDGRLEEIGRSAADVLFAFGENSGALVKIEAVKEEDDEKLVQHIQQLKEQLVSERAEHAAEIEQLNNEHERELSQLRQELDHFKAALDQALTELESKGLITEEARHNIEERSDTSAESPKETIFVDSAEEPVVVEAEVSRDGIKLEPGDKVRIWHGRDTVEREVYGIKDGKVGIFDPDDPEKKVYYISPDLVRPATAVEETSYLEETTPRGLLPRRRVVVEEFREFASNNPVIVGLGAVAAGAAGVLGAVLWETVGERIFGFHDGGVTKKEIISIINHHDSVLRHRVHALSSHVAGLEAAEKVEKAHEHTQDLALQHLKREELKESNTLTAYKFAFRYPWDWAANKVGIYRATPWLETLANKAAAHGHKVQWIFNGYLRNGAKDMILKVDGTTNTRHVVSVLNQYR